MGYLLASDGKEKQSLFYGDPSPDARWYLAEGYKLNFTLIDLPTGRQYGFDAPAVPRWTPAGQIMTVKRL